MKKRGFSLIELLVVVLILAILMAVLFPLYLSAKTDWETKERLAPIVAAVAKGNPSATTLEEAVVKGFVIPAPPAGYSYSYDAGNHDVISTFGGTQRTAVHVPDPPH